MLLSSTETFFKSPKTANNVSFFPHTSLNGKEILSKINLFFPPISFSTTVGLLKVFLVPII